jgi:hypothetical protein
MPGDPEARRDPGCTRRAGRASSPRAHVPRYGGWDESRVVGDPALYRLAKVASARSGCTEQGLVALSKDEDRLANHHDGDDGPEEKG